MDVNRSEEVGDMEYDEESTLICEIAEMRNVYPEKIVNTLKNASANKMTAIQKAVAENKLNVAANSAEVPSSTSLTDAINAIKTSSWYTSRDSTENTLKDIKEQYRDIQNYKAQIAAQYQ